MTCFHSESSLRPLRFETGAAFSINGSTSPNSLPHNTFAKIDAWTARPVFLYRAGTVATGASTSQLVLFERSTAPRMSPGRAISHCEVTEWHRTVTWGMRIGNSSHRQHSGGYDDRRY